MSAATNYLESKVADHVLGTASFTAPTNVYVALYVGDPGEDCDENVAEEDTRKIVTFEAAVDGTAVSATDCTWTDVAAAETYTHWAIWDGATIEGNPLVWGELDDPVAMGAGDTFTIPAGLLTVSVA